MDKDHRKGYYARLLTVFKMLASAEPNAKNILCVCSVGIVNYHRGSVWHICIKCGAVLNSSAFL